MSSAKLSIHVLRATLTRDICTKQPRLPPPILTQLHESSHKSNALITSHRYSCRLDVGNSFYFLIFFSTFFIYFWNRERQSMNGGGSEGGRHRIQNRLQALSCRHSTEPDAGLELADREIVTWLKSDAQPTAPPRRPRKLIFKCNPLWWDAFLFSTYRLCLNAFSKASSLGVTRRLCNEGFEDTSWGHHFPCCFTWH